MVERARALRRTMTPPEVRLWQWLRTRPGGFKFRHQHPTGPYVFDFYCAAVKLVIEVDGEVHARGDRPERDIVRDAWCAGQGMRVMRIAALDVMQDLDAVSRAIMSACGVERADFPSTSFAGPPPHAKHGEE
ncbi:endonuclease domain-containing protein [Sphingomonas sp. RT2P30]|uniref:endonuclease domain-containing protein n=1 Tax=Parasphingomonas halimpatiens TaxID=3096162 RepID=UPI002FC910E7